MLIIKIFFAFLSVGLLGGLLGVGLAFASKLLAVKKDERQEELENILPGLNCGACGYAGCSSYAKAMLEEDEEVNLCAPGGPEVKQKLADFLGREIKDSGEKMIAQVHCRGTRENVQVDFHYEGISDCNALYMLYHGDKNCKVGCLGLGSCIDVCPVDAIDYDKEGCVWVDRELCINCRKCVEVCPTGVIKMIPASADYLVACNSHEKGGIVKKQCSVGCIGCRICTKKSPEGGFIVEDFLAHIDYSFSGEREGAQKKCPPKCIVPITGIKGENSE